MNLEQLRALRNELADKMASLAGLEAEGTELSDEQAQEFESAEAEFHKLDARIRRAEGTQKAQSRLAERRPSVGAAQLADALSGDGPSIPSGPEAKTSFECFEEFLAAGLHASLGTGSDQRLEWSHAPQATQRLGSGTEGGFMVPVEFRSEMLRVNPDANPLLSAVRRLGAGSSPDAEVMLPKLNQKNNQFGGVTVSWIQENEAAPETGAKLEMLGWSTNEVAAHIPLSQKLITNWSGATGFAQSLLRDALNAELETVILRGNGIKKPLGILPSKATYAVPRSIAGDFTFDDVAAMVERRLLRGDSAFWLVNQLLLSRLMKMTDSNGNLIWQSNAREGAPSSLNGLPLYFYPHSPAVGELGDVLLVQPSYYLLKEGVGPLIDFGKVNTDFLQGLVRIRVLMSIGGRPWLDGPFKHANGIETSPFLALDLPSA